MRQVSLIAAVITVMLSTAPMCYARVAKQKLSIAPDVCLGDGDDGTVSQFVNKGGKFPLFVRIDGSDDLAGGVLAPITPTVATDCRFSMDVYKSVNTSNLAIYLQPTYAAQNGSGGVAAVLPTSVTKNRDGSQHWAYDFSQIFLSTNQVNITALWVSVAEPFPPLGSGSVYLTNFEYNGVTATRSLKKAACVNAL